MTEEADIEFIEPDEGFNYGKGERFSHPQLVMSAMDNCRLARAKQMKEGYTTYKLDKFGNKMRYDIGDTRLEFIESVESLKMVMGSDIDDNIQKKLDEIIYKINFSLCKYLNKQIEFWGKMDGKLKNINPVLSENINNRVIDPSSPFYTFHLMEKVELMTEVYVILDKRAKELGYYKEGIREA